MKKCRHLHYETVSSYLRCVLGKLMASNAFSDFVLVGGTSLSLQRGHRMSIDIDMFTALHYGEMPTEKIKEYLCYEFPYHDGIEGLDERSVGYSLYIGESKSACIKLDLFYTEPFLFPALHVDGIRLADERDIAAMKLLAITSATKRQKDFWDIHELLDDYSLKEMVDIALERYPYELSKEEILSSISEIDSIEDPVNLLTIKPKYCDLVKLDLKLAARDLT